MTQIAVLVFHPDGSPSAHLVDTASTVAEATSDVVSKLSLPSQVTYELHPAGSEKSLPADSTLEICGIQPGAELRLRAVRDRTLKEVTDQLYADADRLVRDQQWQAGKQKLDQLFGLDPAYPDPLGLEDAVEQQTAPARISLRPASQPARPTVRQGSAIGNGAKAAPAVATLLPDTSGKYRLVSKRQTKGRGRLGRAGCVLASALLFVAAVGTGMVLNSPELWPALVQAMGLQVPQPAVNSLGSGDVQVTLRWSGPADLDLRVTAPGGDEVRFDTRRSESGGTLDMDANEGCEQQSENPTENIYWADGIAPAGTYTVSVVYFQECNGSGVTDYEVTVTRNRESVSSYSGQIAAQDGSVTAATFEYSRP